MALPWLIGVAVAAGAAAAFSDTCRECGDRFFSSDYGKYCSRYCRDKARAREERARREREKEEKLNKLKNNITKQEKELQNYIENQKNIFKEQFNVEIDFDDDYNLSILEYSNEQIRRKERIKALEKEAQELSEVISILKDKRDAVS